LVEFRPAVCRRLACPLHGGRTSGEVIGRLQHDLVIDGISKAILDIPLAFVAAAPALAFFNPVLSVKCSQSGLGVSGAAGRKGQLAFGKSRSFLATGSLSSAASHS